MIKQSTSLSSFITIDKNIIYNDDHDDDAQVKKQISINDVVAIRDKEFLLSQILRTM